MNLGHGAGSLRVSIVARTSSVVALHETRVVDAVVGSLDADTTVALLHNNSQDEARVDAGRLSDGADSALDIVDLIIGVVLHVPLSTARFHGIAVAFEHVVEARDPLFQGGPAVRHQTGTAENRRVQVAAAFIERVSGHCILRLAQERGWHWSPENEGEAASSKKLGKKG